MKVTWWMALCLATPLTGCVTVTCPCACHPPGAPAATESSAPPTRPPPDRGSSPSGPAAEVRPPAALELDSIPVRAALREGRGDAFAVFEVEGDDLVAVAYEQRAIAEGALALWRELVFRIPTNQRLDLVQFEITKAPDPAGATDNSGTGSRTGRFGYVLSFSAFNLGANPPDPAAPLSRRRGTFDWTLIHEFGHLRTYADGSVNDYIAAFGGETGPGDGYPADGAPRLDGAWVSSYAERAGGDEDCAESFTAFVMLDELPQGDSLAARKVRWFAARPGYPELRRALRITEPDGSSAPLEPAPRAAFPLVVEPAAWMVGRWSTALADGAEVVYEITRGDIVRTRSRDGTELERWSYRGLREVDPLATVDLYEVNESFYLHQVSLAGASFSESFRRVGDALHVENERLGAFALTPSPR